MPENSLSAAIAGNLAQQDAEETPAAPKSARPANQSRKKKPKKKPRETVLVGGHFAPAVLKQLKIIAVEEETTNQALLEEALDMLFVKKGRAKIESL